MRTRQAHAVKPHHQPLERPSLERGATRAGCEHKPQPLDHGDAAGHVRPPGGQRTINYGLDEVAQSNIRLEAPQQACELPSVPRIDKGVQPRAAQWEIYRRSPQVLYGQTGCVIKIGSQRQNPNTLSMQGSNQRPPEIG